jgi:hypothetical protein
LADVAQLVEQSIRNRQVIGSSPIVGSIFFAAALHPAGDFPSLKFAFAPVVRRSARVGLAAYCSSHEANIE